MHDRQYTANRQDKDSQLMQLLSLVLLLLVAWFVRAAAALWAAVLASAAVACLESSRHAVNSVTHHLQCAPDHPRQQVAVAQWLVFLRQLYKVSEGVVGHHLRA